jgi:4-hydroxysphinganine ceramide fatty acyl 2-hydroxylase
MPLPTIPLAEVQSRSSAKSCYVVLGTNVYDVTEFIEDHPGGADLILEHAGTDVGEIMKDTLSHFHSESAYDILEDHLVGYLATESSINASTNGILPHPTNTNGAKEFLNGNATVYAATGISCAEDLSRETDFDVDYKTHKFLDLNKPLLLQIFNGGFSKEFYLEQVHRPRHYKGGDSAPLFGNFLEPLSKTPWWVVPTVWLPPVAYGTFISAQELGSLATPLYWILGLCLWTIIEYTLHRFLFHLDE